MTVVSYLKLSDKAVMGCADERQSTSGGRTTDVARKIDRIGKLPAFAGYSGAISHRIEISEELAKKAATLKYLPEVAETFREVYGAIRERKFKQAILDKFGTSMDEWKKGTLHGDLMGSIARAVELGEYFSISAMVGGYDEKSRKTKLYVIGYPGVIYHERKYSTIGSGSDRAQIILDDAVALIEPDKRQNIPPYQGAKILMEATRSGWHNWGVGGRSQLVWVTEKEFHELGKDESNVLNNLLYCEKRGVLSKRYVDGLFKSTIEDGAKAREMVKDVAGKIESDELADMFFRQSLHL